MVVRVKCEGEWNSIVVLSLRRLHDDGRLEQQKQDSHVCQRNCTFPPILMKNQSRQYKDDEI